MACPIRNFFLVRNEHLNHHGNLFGGVIMAEMDTVGYCIAQQMFPGCAFVTRASSFVFESAARLGDIVEFEGELARRGVTSVTIHVAGRVGGRLVAKGEMTYVNVNAQGAKTPVPA
ncbi:MAG TPA: acyl-CoA thioesterase [Candidatus Brocadiia bacterium]|nr:acyl-CoA thioesterase [Candidatus Brocadiia bacterium]